MSVHSREELLAFLKGETRQVWARDKATGEPRYLPVGDADRLRSVAKRDWACIIPTCDAAITTRGGSLRDHFVHQSDAGHGEGGAAETFHHQAAKAMLSLWATQTVHGVEVVEEKTIKRAAAQRDRRPDVTITWPNASLRPDPAGRGLPAHGRPEHNPLATDFVPTSTSPPLGSGPAVLALEVEYKKFSYEDWAAKELDFASEGIARTWLLGHTRLRMKTARGDLEGWDGAVTLPKQALILAAAGLHVLVINPDTGQIGTVAGDRGFTSRVGPKQSIGWLGLDAISDCAITTTGLWTPAMRRLEEAIRARELTELAAQQEARQRHEQRARRQALHEAQRDAERQAEAARNAHNAEIARQRAAVHARWATEEAAWRQSSERARLIERWGQIPRVIEEFGASPRGIDAHPVHWHAVVYEQLIHRKGPQRTFGPSQCWQALSAAGISWSRKKGAALASLSSFLTALETEGLIRQVDEDHWEVRRRYATLLEQQSHRKAQEARVDQCNPEPPAASAPITDGPSPVSAASPTPGTDHRPIARADISPEPPVRPGRNPLLPPGTPVAPEPKRRSRVRTWLARFARS